MSSTDEFSHLLSRAWYFPCTKRVPALKANKIGWVEFHLADIVSKYYPYGNSDASEMLNKAVIQILEGCIIGDDTL